MRKAVLSTVYETFYEEHPTGKEAPRIRVEMSDGTLAKFAFEFGEGYKELFSGSSILSVIDNNETVSIVRVEEFDGETLKPKAVTHVFGEKVDLQTLPDITDIRWKTLRGHPIQQIPQPHSLKFCHPEWFK